MRRYFAFAGMCVFVLSLCLPACGQRPSGESSGHVQESVEEKEPVAILEPGVVMDWDTRGGAATFAPTLGVEFTPIEHWLEIEMGVAPFYTQRSTKWDTNFLFKKPWTISRKAEFMLGAGPEWAHETEDGKTSDSIEAEVSGEFMFWPNGRHRFGWFVEPAWDYSFAGGHPQSIGLSIGLLFGIGHRQR